MLTFRSATSDDAAAIAALHADSWRRHYRGAYPDSYLDGEADADRLVVWTERLRNSLPTAITIVATDDGDELVGFAHTILREDAKWGALLDNLHVQFAFKRGGVGTNLMVETARAVIDRSPGEGLYLWVLEQNTAAQAFYSARGGTCVERSIRPPFAGGREVSAFRYVWSDPAVLLTPSTATQRRPRAGPR